MCGTIVYYMISLVDSLVYVACLQIFNSNDTYMVLQCSILGTIFVLTFLYLYKLIIKKQVNFEKNRILVIFVSIFFVYGTRLIFYPYMSADDFQINRYVANICVYCIVAIIFMVTFILLSNQNSEYKIKEKVNYEKNRVMYNYYQQVEERDKEIRRFRHDYKNHIRGIKYYLSEKKYEELEKYVESIDGEGFAYSQIVDVGHNYINAILSHYVSETSKSDIKLVISGDASRASIIDDYDWSTIIPNLLNNAIEATRQIEDEDKTIEISFKYIRNKIVVSVTNPIKDDVNIPDLANIKTSKKDKLNHGYGIKNIRNSVEKYHGDLTCKIDENNQFVIVIWLQSDHLSC